jgi:hypothetical protein
MQSIQIMMGRILSYPTRKFRLTYLIQYKITSKKYHVIQTVYNIIFFKVFLQIRKVSEKQESETRHVSPRISWKIR